MKVVMTRSYYWMGHQHVENVRRVASNEFEIEGHAAGAHGGPYKRSVLVSELLRMSNFKPFQPA